MNWQFWDCDSGMNLRTKRKPESGRKLVVRRAYEVGFLFFWFCFLLGFVLSGFVGVLFVCVVRAEGVWHTITKCRFGAGLVLAKGDRNTIECRKNYSKFR